MNFLQHQNEMKTTEFSDFDSKKRFRNNQKKFKNKWSLYNYRITYKKNPQGFRTHNFKKLDWNDSYVIIGCSNVFGLGLKEEHTLAKILEKKLKKPVVNLGISGSAIDTACYNSFQIYKSGQNPKGIIHIWTSLFRYMHFRKSKIIRFFLPTQPDYHSQLFWEDRNKFTIEMDRELWRSKGVPYFEYSFFPETANELDITFFKTLDTARDLMHPGIESNKKAAEIVYRDIIEYHNNRQKQY